MPDIKITIKNLDNLKAAFGSYPEIVAPMLRDASSKSAFEVERRAKILSPVDTGRLRASIATSLGIVNKGITSIVSTNVFYAIYVHEGTRRMRGRPFMRQAAEASVGQIQKHYQDAESRAMQAIANLSQ